VLTLFEERTYYIGVCVCCPGVKGTAENDEKR
jgi:hypothetical protein